MARSFRQRYRGFTQRGLLAEAREAARTNTLRWDAARRMILSALARNPELFPLNIGARSLRDYLAKWLRKYDTGHARRPSVRSGEPMGTIPDEIVDMVIQIRLPKLSKKKVLKIRKAHRLSMQAENLVGEFLEEYLAKRLARHGWYCAWGATIRHADFCSATGELLQVKNRSNTENSPGRLVRDGTHIRAWYRINARTGVTNWAALRAIVRGARVSEGDFRRFVRRSLDDNRGAFFLERGVEF